MGFFNLFNKSEPTILHKSVPISFENLMRFFGVSGGLSDTKNLITSQQQLNAYTSISFVGTAASIIASDTARLGYQIVDSKNNQIEDDQILNLLKNPNKNEYYGEFISRLILHLLLDGNCFIRTDSESTIGSVLSKKISSLDIVVPSTVDVYGENSSIVGGSTQCNDRKIDHFMVQNSIGTDYLLQTQLYHSKLASPFNSLRGVGVIARNQNAMDAERLTTLFNAQMTENSSLLNLAITLTQEKSPTMFEQIKKNIRDQYGESIMVLNNGFEVKPLNISQRDMQLIEQLKLSRENVFHFYFGIPPIRVGVETAKYDSATEQLKIYYNDVLPGFYQPVEELLTDIISVVSSKKGLFFKFIRPKIENKKEIFEMATSGVSNGIITPGEARDMLGLTNDPKNKHLNTFYLPLSLIPAESAGYQAAIEATPAKSLISGCNHKAEAGKLGWAIHRRSRKSRDGIEPKVRDAVSGYYKGLERRVLKNFDELTSRSIKEIDKNSIDDLLNSKEEKITAMQDIRKVHTATVSIAIGDLNEIVGSTVDSSFKNNKVRLVVDKLGIRYANQTLNSRIDELRSLIDTAINDGVSISEIKGRLVDYFDTLNDNESNWRADRIARTESSYAYDQAAKLSYNEIGVKNVQVIGCQQQWPDYDCDTDGTRGTYPIEDMDSLNFHPNHGGSIVPVIEQ